MTAKILPFRRPFKPHQPWSCAILSQLRQIARHHPDMWVHACYLQGPVMVGKDEPCNWCGATESTEVAANDQT